MINPSDILAVTKAVTQKWTKQRKAEERGHRSRGSRGESLSGRLHLTDVMGTVLPAGYQHASGGGKYTVSKRQFYYAVRDEFKRLTGRPLTFEYFCNTLLRQYMNRHPETDLWKVTADAHGKLSIPNTAVQTQIPCGTLEIDEHLDKIRKPIDALKFNIELACQWPSLAPGQRYQAVLYVEKEGFDPMLEEAQIAERFDIAIVSCKGQSVKAARQFVDEVCRVNGGVPLFVVHDFDKSGFEISQRLTRVSALAEKNDSVLYRFKNEINVTDLGLRLSDVEEYDLAWEEWEFNGHFADDSICTEEEREFLRSGRRVELNAFTAPQFIEWLEAKLTEQGLAKRLVPDRETLEAAYRRAVALTRLNSTIEKGLADAIYEAKNCKVPQSLDRQLKDALQDSETAWDGALYQLVKTKLNPESAD